MMENPFEYTPFKHIYTSLITEMGDFVKGKILSSLPAFVFQYFASPVQALEIKWERVGKVCKTIPYNVTFPRGNQTWIKKNK